MEMHKVMLVAGWSLACFSACGSEGEGSERNSNRGSAGSAAQRAPVCPADRPMPRAVCAERGLTCDYEQGDCTCQGDSMGAFGTLVWNCPMDFRAQMCPATAPMPGASCQTVFGECEYGDSKTCDCVDETDMWACWNPADCPAMPPENQSACDPVGMECEYDAQMLDCDCTAQGWDCD